MVARGPDSARFTDSALPHGIVAVFTCKNDTYYPGVLFRRTDNQIVSGPTTGITSATNNPTNRNTGSVFFCRGSQTKSVKNRPRCSTPQIIMTTSKSDGARGEADCMSVACRSKSGTFTISLGVDKAIDTVRFSDQC